MDVPFTKKNLRCDDGYVVIYSGDKMYQVINYNVFYNGNEEQGTRNER